MSFRTHRFHISAYGALSIYPSNLPPPPPAGSGTTVNFFDVNAIGNTTIARVCEADCPVGGELAVLARNTDRDVVIDVQGYFYSARDSGTCSTADLAGSWQTFVAEPATGGTTCGLSISESGAIDGNCNSTAGELGPITSGQWNTEDCTVTGSFTYNDEEFFLNAARLSVDRNQVTGIVNIEGFVTTITAFRR